MERVYNIQAAKDGGVLPSVFQDSYNAVSCHVEVELFLLLRKLKIVFLAYSPIAEGFLVKSHDSLRKGTDNGRFAKGANVLAFIYNSMYVKDSLLDALVQWEKIAAL